MGKNSDVLTRIIKKDEAKKSTSSATPGAGSAAAYGGGGNKGSPALPEKESIRSYTEALIARRNTARQRTEMESTNPYIRALAEQSGKTAGKMAGSAANIYHQALSGAGTPTGATWEDTNALTRRTSAAPAGNTWEDTNALARETAPAPTYAELLKRNYAAQFSGQGVTQQMQAELENAGRAESDYRARKRRAEMDRIGQDIAANMNPYANVQPAAPERKAAADGVTEQMTTAEVKAALPGLQEAADYARDRYQKIWDRNIRIGTDQGQVPPEMIAELWEAERDKNETEQRLNLALARNEELSYGDMLGNTKTDLSRVGELQERLEKVTGAGGSTRGMSVDQIRTEQQEVVGALNGIRASLRAEGYSDEEITALFGYLRRERNAENAKAMQEEARAAAAERGSLGNLAINTGTGLLGGAGYIDLAMQNLFAGQDAVTGQRARVDYNSPAQSMYQIGEATMQGEMDKLLDRYGVTDENGNRDFTTEGKIRAGAYQLTASMGQSATVAGLTAMGVPCAMLLLSGNAATQTTHEMHEKGYSDGTALLMGGIAGAAEYVTEKIGMDELFKTRDISTAKNLLRGLLHNQVNQALAEGGEEVLSTVINTLADLIVNGDKNELETRYREFLSAGYTPEQAEKAAAQEWLGGVWQDFYMGALSGLLFGGAGTAIQSASNAVADTRTGKTILSEGTANALIDEIGALDSDIAQTANVPAVDENSKARQLGAAQRGLERARTMENMRAELEARGEENVTPALLSGLYASSQRQEQRLTGEEKRAMRGSETAQELAEEWAKQWKDGSVPAPFAGAEEVLRAKKDTGRFSIETNPDGSKYVKADRQILSGDDPAEWGKQLQRYINEQIRKGEDVTFTTEDGHEIKLTGRSAYKLSDRHAPNSDQLLSDEQYSLKENAAGHIDELVQTANFDNYEEDLDHKHENDIGEDGFNYYTAFFEDGDGTRYRIPISAALNGEEETAYSIGRIRQRKTRTGRGPSAQTGGAQSGAGLSMDTNTTSGNQSQEKKTAFQLALEEAMRKKGITDEQSYFGEQSGDDGVGAGEQAGNDEGRTAQGAVDARDGGRKESNRFEDLVREEVTPADLGVTRGSTSATVRVLDESGFEEGSPEAEAARIARENGLEPVFILGTLQIGEGEKAKQARAYIKGNRVILQADGKYGADQYLKHEIYHKEARKNKNLNRIIREALANNLGEEAMGRLVEKYIQAYDGIYDFTGMSQKEIMELCEEELFADVYAGIDNLNLKEDLREQVQSGFAEAQTSQESGKDQDATGPPEGRAQAFIGYDKETGKGIYESNYPENSPAEPKRKRLIQLVQNIWSKKPIDLVIQNKDGTTQVIQAQFDPDFDETGERKTDLGKLAYGNWRGNKKEKRVTLNLADDYYQILQEAKYITKADNYDDASKENKDVEQWRYFVNDILYQEQGKKEKTPYSMYTDVKQKPSGNYVYTFHAEETGKNNGQTTPQTIPATVNSSENGTANGLPTDTLADTSGKSNPPNEGRASAEVPAEGKLWLDDEATAADAAKAAEDGRTVAMENGSGRIEIRRTSKGNYAVEFYDRAEEAYGERPNSTAMFKTAGEAAEYADAYRSSYQTALEDRELDEARGKPESGKPKGEAGTIPAPFAGTGTTAAEDYNNEVIRQKKAKAAEVNTQTLRERIRRADEELRALRRLDKTTELTEAQKAHKADVQETLEIMNDELERRKAQAKANRGKGKPAKEKPARAVESMPTKSARDARLALQDMFSTRRGAWNETGKAIDEKLAEIARSGKISEESRQELFDILMDNGAVYKEAEEVFRNIRDTVRGSRLYVSEHDRHDFGDNWDSLRKKAFAAGIYLTNDITDQKVDSLVQELGETFGENLFPQDDALSDMLNNLIERSEQGRNTWQPLSESIEDEAKRYREDPQEIFDSMWEQMNRTLQTFAEKADLEIDLKERSAAQLAEERQRWEDRMERRSRARLESEIRGKVLKGLQRLARAKNKTAPDTKAQIEEVLKDIDTQARQITPAGLEDLQGLYRAYEDAKKDAGYQDDENMGNWIPNPYVEERLARLTQKHVNDMSIDEVIELGRTVAALEHSIATQNQMLGEEWDRTITEEAYNVRREVEAAKGAKAGFLHKWAKEEHLSPRRFLEMLGGWTDGTMKKLSHSLEEGQTRMLDFQRRATQSFDSFLSKKENRKWLEKASGKKAEWTKYTVLDGMDEDGGSYTDIELTPMMKISLYLHSRNMDNLRHIQTGGLVIPNKELYRQGKIAEAYAQGQRVKMNPETVRKIAGELTATEKTFANHMTKVFDEISKEAINEVSLQLDGFERAGVDNYMPIETARQFIKSDVAGEARAQTVEGIGSIANERIHASNPIVLSDASDVLMRQIDKVSRYYGYAIPIRNFQAVNNYVFHKEGNAFETSVKELMDRKWGAGAEQYITKMLEDLQSNGRQGDMMSSALAKLRGNLAGATLMFNPSVALSQVASYPGAAQVVGWDGLAAGLTAGKVDTGLMEKYTPLYWYRNQGNSTQELGDYMKDKGLEQKLPWILNWIQKMDSATIRRLWAASEYRVRKDNPGLKPGPQADIDAGTDAYYKAVAEVFNRAVYDTQPNYTNMERAQILRSKSDVTRFLTMYKTVPLQYYGMMVEASGRLEAARKAAKADGSEANQEALRKAQKYAVNTYGGLLAANAAYVTVKALFKGLRGKDKDYRDEEGKLTAGSVSRQLGRDLLETYAGSIIGGAEALDVADSLITGSKFYGPEMSALSYVEDMVNAVQSIVSAAQSEDPRKAAKAVKDGAETLAQGFGVPAKNLETYTIGIIGNLWPEVGVEYANMFGGIDRSNLKGMDEDALGTAAGLILSGRTGEKTDRAVSDELARLYAAGETVAVPTATPQSFSYNGTTVQIRDRGAYSDTWGGIVNDCMEPLMASQDYLDADDSGKASLINRLYEYATVQARKGADSNYTAEGNSTYGWTVKADEAVEAGVPVVDTICALTAFSGMTADKDENGNSISGSKKAKVCDYIDEMDITDEQKDVMYLLAGYKENSLEYTPWHGYVEEEGSGSGKKSGSGKGSKSGRSGGRRRGSGGSSRAVKAKSLPGAGVSGTRRSAGANVPAGNTGGRIQGDVTDRLLEIIDKYYDGNMLAAAFDGGRKARSRIDFEI